MHVQLDAQGMRAAMDLWRQEVRLTTRPDGDVLSKLSGRLGGWLDLLRLCSPNAGEPAELQAIAKEVEQRWD